MLRVLSILSLDAWRTWCQSSIRWKDCRETNTEKAYWYQVSIRTNYGYTPIRSNKIHIRCATNKNNDFTPTCQNCKQNKETRVLIIWSRIALSVLWVEKGGNKADWTIFEKVYTIWWRRDNKQHGAIQKQRQKAFTWSVRAWVDKSLGVSDVMFDWFELWLPICDTAFFVAEKRGLIIQNARQQIMNHKLNG